MKFRCLVPILFSAQLMFAQAPIGGPKPLTESQLSQLVAAGMDNERLAKTVSERGIEFELSGSYLAGLRQKGALPVVLKALGEVALKTGHNPLDKNLLQELVVAGSDSLALAKAVIERGIDFQPGADYLQALHAAGALEILLKALREAMPRPLARDQLLSLVTGGVASDRVAALVKRRGINFKASEEYLETLRITGANAAVISAVQAARRPPEFVLVHTLEGHHGTVRSLAFSPDGRLLASASVDATIKLWDVAGGREARNLTGHADIVYSVAFSPDGRYLVSAGLDRTVRLWEVGTGREPRVLTGHTSEVESVSYCPDGRYVASGSLDGTIRFWDLEVGITVRSLAGRVGKAVAFSPDGRLLAGGCYDNAVRLWEVDTGREVQVLKGHAQIVNWVAFDPDGRHLVSAASDNTIKIWEVATGREIRTLTGHSSSVWQAVFTPDGRYLASGSADGTLRIWEVESGLEVEQLATGPVSTVPALAFSRDGRYLAGSTGDNILLWKRED